MASTAEQRHEADFVEIGSTGLRQFGGRIDEEFHPKLRGGRQSVQVFTEMSLNDASVGALLFAFNNLLRQVEFRATQSGDTPAHAEQAEFLETAIEDMSITWQDLISEILSMLTFGWSYFETVYKRRLGPDEDPSKRSKHNDGKVGWRKHAIRSQDSLDRWEIGGDGGLQGAHFYSSIKQSTVFIPIEKALLFRTVSRKGSPEGVSLLRTGYRAWFMKKRLEELEAIGAKRDLVGLPDFTVPHHLFLSQKSEDKNALARLKEQGQRVQQDEYACVVRPSPVDQEGKPTGYDFGLVKSGGARQFNLHQSIVRYRGEILMSVLAQFLALGQDKVGSFSLASTQTNLFSYALGAVLDSVTDVFNRIAIPRLMTLNAVPVDLWPTLEHGDIERPELAELSQYVATLVGAGALSPDDNLEGFLREHGTLPPVDVEAHAQGPRETPAEKRKRARKTQLNLFGEKT